MKQLTLVSVNVIVQHFTTCTLCHMSHFTVALKLKNYILEFISQGHLSFIVFLEENVFWRLTYHDYFLLHC